jgi:toxin ParE1/3/4
MMARIVRTPQAIECFIAIGEYIEEQSQSLEIAKRFLRTIDAKCEQYARQPLMGDRRPDLGTDVHCFTVGNYVVLYRPLCDGIELLLVVHGARDIPAVFRDQFTR